MLHLEHAKRYGNCTVGINFTFCSFYICTGCPINTLQYNLIQNLKIVHIFLWALPVFPAAAILLFFHEIIS